MKKFCDKLIQLRREKGYSQEQLAENQLEWVGRMNNVQACAREIVDKEVIYQ